MKITLGRRAGPAVLLLAGCIGVAALAAPRLPRQGAVAPAWSGKTVDGKQLASAQLKGKVVVLNFFGYT
jgi:cytochrome oxidase Cu insertion factor (SCO1/SenC/PrrC family)